ncbi:unnamed protein product [Prorocentrum cordatum]|uniref:N-acetyltransferase domain-containing protein n=1 Tax=Prorocentrum cordatum TaxID=2364126 RepID=A0ABN9QG26_9DINO|nr:unnamed protein product [Polarella glacialis]
MLEAGQTHNAGEKTEERSLVGGLFLARGNRKLEAAVKLDQGPMRKAILQDSLSDEIFGTCKAKVAAQGRSASNGKTVIKRALKPYAIVKAALIASLKKEGAEFQLGPAPRVDTAREDPRLRRQTPVIRSSRRVVARAASGDYVDCHRQLHAGGAGGGGCAADWEPPGGLRPLRLRPHARTASTSSSMAARGDSLWRPGSTAEAHPRLNAALGEDALGRVDFASVLDEVVATHARGTVRLVKATSGGRCIGYVLYELRKKGPARSRQHFCELVNIVVRPEQRGCGAGRRLFEALERDLETTASREARDMRLYVAERNGGPREWYRRMGFEDAGWQTEQVGGEQVRFLRMCETGDICGVLCTSASTRSAETTCADSGNGPALLAFSGLLWGPDGRPSPGADGAAEGAAAASPPAERNETYRDAIGCCVPGQVGGVRLVPLPLGWGASQRGLPLAEAGARGVTRRARSRRWRCRPLDGPLLFDAALLQSAATLAGYASPGRRLRYEDWAAGRGGDAGEGALRMEPFGADHRVFGSYGGLWALLGLAAASAPRLCPSGSLCGICSHLAQTLAEVESWVRRAPEKQLDILHGVLDLLSPHGGAERWGRWRSCLLRGLADLAAAQRPGAPPRRSHEARAEGGRSGRPAHQHFVRTRAEVAYRSGRARAPRPSSARRVAMRALLAPALLAVCAALSHDSRLSPKQAGSVDEQSRQGAAVDAGSGSSAQQAVVLNEQSHQSAGLDAISGSSAQQAVILDEQSRESFVLEASSRSSEQQAVILDEQSRQSSSMASSSGSSAQQAVVMDEQSRQSAAAEASSGSAAQQAVVLNEQSHQSTVLTASLDSAAQQAVMVDDQSHEIVGLDAGSRSSAQQAVILDEQSRQGAAVEASTGSAAQQAVILDEQGHQSTVLTANLDSAAQQAVMVDKQSHQGADLDARSGPSAQQAVILDEHLSSGSSAQQAVLANDQSREIVGLDAGSGSSAQQAVILDEQSRQSAAEASSSGSSAEQAVILDEQSRQSSSMASSSGSSAQQAVIMDEQSRQTAVLEASSGSSAQQAAVLDVHRGQEAALQASSGSSAQQAVNLDEQRREGAALDASSDSSSRMAAVVHAQFREISALNASVELRIAQMEQDWKLRIKQLEEKLWQVQQEKRDVAAAEERSERRLALLESKLAKMELKVQPSLERRLTQVEEAARAEAQRRASQEQETSPTAEEEFSRQQRSRESLEESRLIYEQSWAMGDLKAAHSAIDRVVLPLMTFAREKVYQSRRQEIEAETRRRLLEEAEGLCDADGDRLDGEQLREVLDVPEAKLAHLAAEVAQVAAPAATGDAVDHTGLRWQERLEGFRQKSAAESAHVLESIVHKIGVLSDIQGDYDDRMFLEMLARFLNDTRDETQHMHETNALIHKRLQENYGKYNTEYLSSTLLQAISGVTENVEFKNHLLHMDTYALSHTTPGEEMVQGCQEMERVFASHILPFFQGVGHMRGTLDNLTKVVPSMLSTAGQKRSLAMMRNRTKGMLSMAYAQQIALRGVSNAIMHDAIPVLVERLHCNFTDPSSSAARTSSPSSPRTLLSRIWSRRQ